MAGRTQSAPRGFGPGWWTWSGLLAGGPSAPRRRPRWRRPTWSPGAATSSPAVAERLRPDVETVVVGAGLDALDRIAAHAAHGGPVCVLASGDPGFWGISRALGARLGADRLRVHPAPSSVSLAFARLGLPWEDAVVRSCHRGGAARVAAEVVAAPLAAVLCGPAAPPEAVGAALAALGAPHRLVAVCTRLGESGERIERYADAASLAGGRHDHRSVVVLAHAAADEPGPAARPAGGCGAARPVEAFAHRASMITKPEVRAVVLARLDLPAAGVLWDVGAGSGSVAIEAALAAPGLRVVAVERQAADAARITANAAGLGALVEVVEGEAPAALAGLPAPDRVFVGGGGLDVVEACLRALRPGGRLVATFAALDRALAAHAPPGLDGAGPGGPGRTAARRRRPPGGRQPGVRRLGRPLRRWPPRPQGRRTAGAAPPCSPSAWAARRPHHPRSSLRWSTTPRAQLALDLGAAEAPALVIATIDRRADHPAVRALTPDHPPLTFPAALLATVDVPHPSAAVAAAVGTPSVAEAAALLAAGPDARLLVAKQASAGATVAIALGRAAAAGRPRAGRLQIVGLGPGDAAHRTAGAVGALRAADVVVGYAPYVDAVADLLQPRQRVVRGVMGAEAERATVALSLARRRMAGGAGLLGRPRRLRHGGRHPGTRPRGARRHRPAPTSRSRSTSSPASARPRLPRPGPGRRSPGPTPSSRCPTCWSRGRRSSAS